MRDLKKKKKRSIEFLALERLYHLADVKTVKYWKHFDISPRRIFENSLMVYWAATFVVVFKYPLFLIQI